MLHTVFSRETIVKKFFGPEWKKEEVWGEKREKGKEKTEEQKHIEACDAWKKVEGGCARVYEVWINSMLWKNAWDVLSWKKKLSEIEGLDIEDQKELQRMLDRRERARKTEKQLEEDKQRILKWGELTWEVPKQEPKSPEQQRQEFLTQNKTPADRLTALGIGSGSISQWTPLNIPSEKLPAWVTPAQIIPENVASLQVWETTYTRVNGSRGWEFRDEKGNILTGENMKNAKIGSIRSSDDLKRLSDAEWKGLEKYKDLDKYLAQKAKEKWINPDVFITAMKSKLDTNYLADTPDEEKKLKEDTWKKENIDKEIDALATLLSSNAEALKWGDVSAVAEALQKTNPDGWVDTSKQALIKSWKSPAEADTTLKDFIQNMLHTGWPHQRTFSNYWEARDWASSMIGWAKAWELGSLSEEFESGGKWPLAINGNDNGKPSFGTYQLRDGALKQFADEMGIQWNYAEVFENGKESEFAKNWRKKVQEVWADAFKKKEHEFIKRTHFDEMAKNLPFKVPECSLTLQNVIWSIAVQHGPWRTEVITNALAKLGGKFAPWDGAQEKQLIEAIYEVRGKMFESQVGRYQKEKAIALAQLNSWVGGVSNVPAGEIQSLPASRNPVTGVTQCLWTARANLGRFWISVPSVWDSAFSLETYFRQQGKLSPNEPTGKTFMLFTNSLKWNGQDAAHPKYGHAVAGYIQNGQKYILDPYLPADNWQRTTRAIPYDTYVNYLKSSWRGLNWVVNF